MDTESSKLSDSDRDLYYALMQRVNEHFQIMLREHETRNEVISYLKDQRGLTGSTALEFNIGYAPQGWSVLTDTLASPDLSDTLLTLGMLKENDKGHRYDTFRDRVIFPIRNIDGNTIGFGGRVLESDGPKYLNSPESPIFHKGRELYGLYEGLSTIKESKQAVFVEGYMDVVSLAQSGVTNSVATMGTATTEDHIKIIGEYADDLVFCFDGDKAGQKAAKKAVETALPYLSNNLSVRVLLLPDGEDPDTLIKNIGLDGFKDLLENAQRAEEYLIKSSSEGLNLDRMDGEAHYLAKLIDVSVEATPEFRQKMISAVKADNESHHWLFIQGMYSKLAELKTDSGARVVAYPYRDSAPFSMMRRAIALTMQYPKLAKETIGEKVASLDLKGGNVLNHLLGQIKEDTTSLDLLAAHIETNHFPVLKMLFDKDLYITEEASIIEMMEGTIDGLESQMADVRVEELIQKSQLSSLDDNESSELSNLLSANG